jgi:hypothetical protein
MRITKEMWNVSKAKWNPELFEMDVSPRLVAGAMITRHYLAGRVKVEIMNL